MWSVQEAAEEAGAVRAGAKLASSQRLQGFVTLAAASRTLRTSFLCNITARTLTRPLLTVIYHHHWEKVLSERPLDDVPGRSKD